MGRLGHIKQVKSVADRIINFKKNFIEWKKFHHRKNATPIRFTLSKKKNGLEPKIDVGTTLKYTVSWTPLI